MCFGSRKALWNTRLERNHTFCINLPVSTNSNALGKIISGYIVGQQNSEYLSLDYLPILLSNKSSEIMVPNISPPKISPSIRTVDISAWLNPSSTTAQRDSVLEALRYSCTNHGFFSLVGHGIPISLQKQVLQSAKLFFALPMEEKLQVSMANSMGMSTRGYEVLKGQTLQPGALPDLKEVISSSYNVIKTSTNLEHRDILLATTYD